MNGAAVTWPMVALTLVREMPYILMVGVGGVMGVVLALHSPGGDLLPILVQLAPAVIAALGKSRSAETLGETVARLSTRPPPLGDKS